MSSTLLAPSQYCPSLTRYERWKTRSVRIGEIGIGGHNPIRVQSMTTTDTMDTAATVAQSIRMIEAGCELVRITAPSKKDAENLAEIKKRIRAAGFSAPLVADIHFTPNAAEVAARIVEKVRVNPGNYVDKKKFDVREYTDAEYAEELERIRERFTPLVRICKEHGTAMRIGTNHGSLSDRILNRYGDTPEGMVESAFEFLRICRDENYHEIVLSMKASNVQVMVQAYRLLVHRMMSEGWDYPLHLGVTEAGDGEDGRVKSAAGIGALLEDGIGDTVRVSLTEDPEFEIPVARALVDRYNDRRNHGPIPEVAQVPVYPFTYQRRHSREVLNIGARHVPVVIADLSGRAAITPATLFAWGYRYSVPLDKWNITDQACDYAFIGKNTIDFEIPGTLGIIQEHATWLGNAKKDRHYPFLNKREYLGGAERHPQFNLVYATLADLDEAYITALKADPTAVLLIDTHNAHGMAEQRRLLLRTDRSGMPCSGDHRSGLWRHLQRYVGPEQQHRHGSAAHRRPGRWRLHRRRARWPRGPGVPHRVRHPAGHPHAHQQDRVHQLSQLRPHALRPTGDHGQDPRADQSLEGCQDRHHGLHSERPRARWPMPTSATWAPARA
jgi:(E)-4-hydroxy-3-methylbut-2-enyl-diphosphate synthase